MSAMGKSAVSRADLLKMLALQDEQALEKMAFAFGYQQEPIKQAIEVEESSTEAFVKPRKVKLVSKPIERPDKKPAAYFFYVAERERKPHDDQLLKPDVPEFLQQGDILTEDACVERATLALPSYSPSYAGPDYGLFCARRWGNTMSPANPIYPV